MSTLFTKIIRREIPSSILYEDDSMIAIYDINPRAKTHILLIPKKEIPTIDDVLPQDMSIISHLFVIAQKITRDLGIQKGYTLHFNVGTLAGQEIPHIHMHLLSDISSLDK